MAKINSIVLLFNHITKNFVAINIHKQILLKFDVAYDIFVFSQKRKS